MSTVVQVLELVSLTSVQQVRHHLDVLLIHNNFQNLFDEKGTNYMK